MKLKILLDLDGTVANLYGYNDWLGKLRAEIPIYEELEPLVDMVELTAIAKKLIDKGASDKYTYLKSILELMTKKVSEKKDEYPEENPLNLHLLPQVKHNPSFSSGSSLK